MRMTCPVTRQLCMRMRSQAVLLTYPFDGCKSPAMYGWRSLRRCLYSTIHHAWRQPT